MVVGEGALEVDESLLTGEPDLIRKRAGDRLFSGSFCVTGAGYLKAEKVGAESFANRLTTTARSFGVAKTPLQRKVDLVVRFVMLVVTFMSVIILVAALFEGLPNVRLVQIAAVLSGQVPYGLFLMVAVAYALGASAIARQGALVQQVNAVESLSNIDVLCMDKTGTLTANRLVFDGVHPLQGASAKEVGATLGDFARSATASNATNDAVVAGLAGERRPSVDEVPFASARKWSALAFDGPERRGVYAMGAGIYAIDHDVVLGSPLVRGEIPDEVRQAYESYTGVPFGSEGYENTVATVTAQGSLSMFVSWTAILLILFLEPPGRFFLGWRKEVSPDKRPAVLAAVLFVVLLFVWSVDPVGYYFGVLTKPWFIIAAIMGAVAVWFFLVRAIWRADLLDRFLGLDRTE